MDLLDVGLVIAGLVLLVGGGEGLVRGASAIARRLGMSPIVVGLTIVAFATSSPELAVSVGAVLRDEPEIAVGNVVGSNIANILLILGISALLLPLLARRRLVKIDVPVMVGLSVLLLILALDGRISTFDGLLLLAIVLAHMAWSVWSGMRGGTKVESADEKVLGWLPALALVLGGVGLLVLGSQWLVSGASDIARSLGLSNLVIGLTVVAIGTSLPELAASIVAVRKGERDLAVGNIVGSNIINIGIVLGLPAMIAGGGIPVPSAALALDIPLMIAAALALAPIAFTGYVIRRWEGGLFLALYISYVVYLVLWATSHEALEGFTLIMGAFALPIVALTLLLVVAYEVGLRKGRAQGFSRARPDA
ncbi:MAG: calcium/sodium antiporter [Actinomycetia bacterium]|nr:calcium/sodium antiporter [Actinomycetes bacterium]